MKQVETLFPPINYGRVFDQNGYLLGLPDGRVMDIRTAEIRAMEHSDYIEASRNPPSANQLRPGIRPQARQAHELLGQGGVIGKIVLVMNDAPIQ